MNIKHSSNHQPTITFFITILEEKFPFFSCFHQINFKKPTSNKPNILQALHFQLKNSENFLLKIENYEPLFAKMPQTHFLSQLKRYFSFM